MPKRKITPELWAEIDAAYTNWNPASTNAPSIDELLRPFGISKQAFYAERRRQGLANKGDWRTGAGEQGGDVVEALLQMVIECRVRIQLLERELELERAKH